MTCEHTCLALIAGCDHDDCVACLQVNVKRLKSALTSTLIQVEHLEAMARVSGKFSEGTDGCWWSEFAAMGL